MSPRESVARAATLPKGFEYTPDGRVVRAGRTGPDRGPVEDLIASGHSEDEARDLQAVLEDFATAAFLADEARGLIDRYAREARQRGATWAQLARRAGIAPQTAQQRWSEQGNVKHNERRRRRTSQTRGADRG